MGILFQLSTSFAVILVEALAVGVLIAGGMWFISSVVLWLFEEFGR